MSLDKRACRKNSDNRLESAPELFLAWSYAPGSIKVSIRATTKGYICISVVAWRRRDDALFNRPHDPQNADQCMRSHNSCYFRRVKVSPLALYCGEEEMHLLEGSLTKLISPTHNTRRIICAKGKGVTTVQNSINKSSGRRESHYVYCTPLPRRR